MNSKCKGIFGLIFGHNVKPLTEVRDYGVKSEGIPIDAIIDTISKESTMLGDDLVRICEDIFSSASACTTIPVGIYCKRCGQIDRVQDLRRN
jgi:hypothetical protein